MHVTHDTFPVHLARLMILVSLVLIVIYVFLVLIVLLVFIAPGMHSVFPVSPVHLQSLCLIHYMDETHFPQLFLRIKLFHTNAVC